MLRLILLISCAATAFGQLRLTIPQGQLIGARISTGLLQSRFWAFRGIPYAEPPIGNLRFRNPVPHRGWNGTLDATRYRNSCPTRFFLGILTPTIDEDCLFLNVYTSTVSGNRPVMVWIHGGGFIFGDGSSNIYGPDFFVNDGGVVVVHINHRLGAFGFLSTNDTAAQGNWAMKDVVEALRWVKNNIRHFGGNPDSVTVFGLSSGGTVAHYLLLNQKSAGLFHRVIMQSGTANLPWTLQPDPASVAFRLGRRLGLSWTDTEDLINQLRTLPWQTILSTQPELSAESVPDTFRPYDWVPNVEPENSPEERFLTDTPTNIMARGNFQKVPMIIGYTSDESLYVILQTIVDRTYLDRFAENPHYYVPMSFNLDPVTQSAEVNEVANAFRDFYFDGQHPHSGIRYNFTQYFSDHVFSFPIDRVTRYHARHQSEPIYYYIFGYDGSLNMLKRMIGLGSYPGAMHGDDIFYMFDVTSLPMPILPNNHALVIRRRIVRMWTDFAKYGDPTPVTDSLIQTRWQPYNLTQENYYDINYDSTNRNRPHDGRLQKWHDFQDRFNPSFV